MVEVFKTNVMDMRKAQHIIDQIHHTFKRYTANFALDDSDYILRINAAEEEVNVPEILRIVNDNGFNASVFPDDIKS